MGGNILFLTGMVDKRTMEKYEREAKEAGRETWYISWALDSTAQERAQGKTVVTESGQKGAAAPKAGVVCIRLYAASVSSQYYRGPSVVLKEPIGPYCLVAQVLLPLYFLLLSLLKE